MKRKFKRIASLVLAAVMVFAMAVPGMTVSADDPATYSITIEGATEGHTYGAYQIFKGTMASTTDIALGDIEWGSNVTMTADGIEAIEAVLGEVYDEDTKDPTSPECAQAVAEALAATGINDNETAQKFADVISGLLNETPAIAKSTAAEGNYTISNLPSGYYLVKDEDPGAGKTLDAYTRFMLQVAHNETVTVKSDVPKVEKKVGEKNDSTETADAPVEYKDAADYDIGDHVPFQLTGTLPTNYGAYESYVYEFNDTLSKGLTYDENSVHVYVVNVVDNVGSKTEVTKDLYNVTNEDGKLTIRIDNLKAAGLANYNITATTKIVVEYTALLNNQAEIGPNGNTNTVTLKYSNNPNEGGSGDTGTTPPDKVTVFTFEVDVHKVEPDPQPGAPDQTKPLEGAEFTLYKWVGKTEADERNQLPDGVDGAQPAGGVENGYWMEVGKVTSTKEKPVSEFKFEGKDSGMYKLVETVTPPGYNTAAPVDFTITAEYETENAADPQLKGLKVTPETAKFTVVETEGRLTGAVETTIVNNEGATLPETGGIGTTIFYVVGSVLVLGAVILLVTKRRMKSE